VVVGRGHKQALLALNFGGCKGWSVGELGLAKSSTSDLDAQFHKFGHKNQVRAVRLGLQKSEGQSYLVNEVLRENLPYWRMGMLHLFSRPLCYPSVSL